MNTEADRMRGIDDESAMRHMLRLVLEKAGYRVDEAEELVAKYRALDKEGKLTRLKD